MIIAASPRKRFLLFGGSIIFLAVIGGLVLAYYQIIYPSNLTSNAENTRTWVIYFAALIALLGWVVSAYVSLYNSTKQHTINILLQSRLSDTFRKYREQVLSAYAEYPQLEVVPISDIQKLKNNNLESDKVNALEALKYLINYYEFIAAGIRHGDLDAALLKSCLRSIICDICTKSEHYIKYIREEEPYGWAKYPKYYEHLLALRDKWMNG